MVIMQEKKKFEAAHSRGQLNKCDYVLYDYLDEDGTNYYRFNISVNRCTAFTVLDMVSHVYLQVRDVTEEEFNLINYKIKEANANNLTEEAIFQPSFDTEKKPETAKTIESDADMSNWSSYSPLKRPEPIDYWGSSRMFQIKRTEKCVPNSKSFVSPDSDITGFYSK